MKRTAISLCALLVLVLAVGDAWAQGKGQGGGKAGGGAGRSASEREAGGQSRPAARRPDTRRQRPPAVEETQKGRIEKAVLHELNGLKYALSRIGALDTKSMKGEQP